MDPGADIQPSQSPTTGLGGFFPWAASSGLVQRFEFSALTSDRLAPTRSIAKPAEGDSSESSTISSSLDKSATPAVDASIFDVVNPAYLLPPDHPVRGSSRTDAGLVLDRELVKLAGMDARLRLVQARLTRRFMDIRGWHPIGFVRLSDYARERLGCSSRTLQDDACVLRRLDGLPRIASALDHAELSWTQARLLSRVASAETEETWLERAAGVSTRELEELVINHVAASPAHDCVEAGPAAEEEESEPVVRWSVPVSPQGRRIWRSACEIASRVAGTPLSPAQVLELVVAESASGVDPAADTTGWSPSAEALEKRLLESRRHAEQRGRSFLEQFLAETGVVDGFGWLTPASREPGPAEQLDALSESLETIDAHELDRRLREIRRVAQRIDYQLATLLKIGVDRRLFREIGFATVKLYVESRLGLAVRNVWNLVAIERTSWRRCKLLREAWRDGLISHLAAFTLLPVVDEINGKAWVQRAGEVTLRRLADEVAWALDSGERDSLSALPAPPPVDAVVPPGGVASVDRNEVQMRAHGETPRDAWPAPGDARLTVRTPVSVALLLEIQLRRYRHGNERDWRTFERLVSHAILEWTSGPRHRDPVFERDGWRCMVPGCTSRRNLHDHHVKFRSKGGGGERENRITVCAAHHLHGIHEGIIEALGKAPLGILWAMGCRAGRRPAMRLLGDRYAEAA
jgi:hypothetical protein